MSVCWETLKKRIYHTTIEKVRIYLSILSNGLTVMMNLINRSEILKKLGEKRQSQMKPRIWYFTEILKGKKTFKGRNFSDLRLKHKSGIPLSRFQQRTVIRGKRYFTL